MTLSSWRLHTAACLVMRAGNVRRKNGKGSHYVGFSSGVAAVVEHNEDLFIFLFCVQRQHGLTIPEPGHHYVVSLWYCSGYGSGSGCGSDISSGSGFVSRCSCSAGAASSTPGSCAPVCSAGLFTSGSSAATASATYTPASSGGAPSVSD
eukprot:COSAG02_NODE_5691_length_4121_cov_2.342118_4_plen_150_part_00